LVPNRGWVIFGGFGGFDPVTGMPLSQKLQTVSGKWVAGPNLYQAGYDSDSDAYNCGVQVNQLFLNFSFPYLN
jgi:hypothetical protein